MLWKPVVLSIATVALATAEASPEVVVEEVAPGFAAAAASLERGDVLFRWRRAAAPPANPESAGGEIRHPFDLWVLETEQAPRGAVTLIGQRRGQGFEATLAAGEWRLEVRPSLAPAELATYVEGRELGASEDAAEVRRAVTLWRGLAEAWESSASARASWLFFRMARLEDRHGLPDGGDGSFGRSLANVEEGASTWRGELYRRWARTVSGHRKKALFEAALDLEEGMSLASASTLLGLALETWKRRDLATTEAHWRRALSIRETLAPASLEVAAVLNNLGSLSYVRGELASAGRYYREALAIRQRLAPESLLVAGTLSDLGVVARNRGDLASAERYYRQALAIRQKLAPESLGVAASLNNLGALAHLRGDLASAERYFQRSLAIKEKLGGPASLELAGTLNNLGAVAQERRELALAERYFLRSLAIRERLAPRSVEVARGLSNLGAVAEARGNLGNAEGYYRRSLSIEEALAPGSLGVAASLSSLGRIARRRGNLTEADRHCRRSLSIREALAPGSLDVATSLSELGRIQRRRGDLAGAERSFRRSLVIRQRLAPGSSTVARTLHSLSQVHGDLKQPEERLRYLRLALAAVESQARRLGGSRSSRGGHLARYAGYYRETVELLVERGRGAEAFHVLERSRVRGLLAMLAERDLIFGELSEELRRERLEANAEHDRILDRLGSWIALQDDDGDVELRRQLTEVQGRQAEIEARIRAASPRLAALQDPEPLTLERTRQVLGPGTLLLAYSLGEERSYLFLVGGREADFAVLPLDTTLATVRSLARRFRERFLDTELGEVLLGPAVPQIGGAKRLVILPDGPLYHLPFAALRVPGSRGEGFRYLVEWKPLSVVGSVTLLAQLKERRRSSPGTVVAFGDPLFPGSISHEATEDPVLRNMVRDGLELPRLPGTRAEVAALERLYPEGSRIYVGAEAKEELAKSVDGTATILHFATHGLLDDRRPLSSALALAIPERWREGLDNGLLQAWEIFEQVRIDADLVTLSGCETALGQESAGEGLLGLTRAFQYAGARTVLASLWAVSDDSTAALMARFYRHLRSGRSKDEALRQAQLELIAGPIEVGMGEARRAVDYGDPYFWAPFQLIGDWR